MNYKHISFLIILSFSLSSCHVGRYFYWNFADTEDHNKFEKVAIHKNKSSFQFQEDYASFNQPSIDLNNNQGTIDLDEALIKSKTAAFIVVKGNNILFEKYYGDYTEATDHPSFSVSKSFISALIGIAIEEGKINSIEDPIRKYLPELDVSFDPVTIEHILNMQSGVKFSEGYFSPFAEVAKFYYGTNLKKFVKKLKVTKEPGTSWQYISGNTQLLSLALEAATDQPLNEYIEEKIWKPLEMEYDASWNIDSKKHQTAKAFCCLNARARDFAKFGRLYLNKGKWNNTQIIPENWVKKTTTFNDSISHNIYAYQWWRNVSQKELGAIKDGINIEPSIPFHSSFQARGILGQFIYINPEKDITIVRLGHKFGKVDWALLFDAIATSN